MDYYKIENTTSGHVLGVYPGDTPEEALDYMYRDAGYESRTQALHTLRGPGETGPRDDSDLRVTRVA